MEIQKWTDSDFDEMTWHLSVLHSLSLPNEKFEFWLDLDFILDAHKTNEENRYELTIAPCLLCFESVVDVKMRLTATIGMNIIEITRTNPSEMKGKLFWDYCILFDSGEITFTSSGYHQKTQAEPKTGWGRQYNYRSLEKHDINFD